MYRPTDNFNVPMIILIPTWQNVSGVTKKIYTADGELIFGSFKTYGGTERDVNGVYSIEDTAIVETWFRPDITSECHLKLAESGIEYDIINEPENIEMRNQFLKFKVRRIKGNV